MSGCNLVATGHGRHSRYGLHYNYAVAEGCTVNTAEFLVDV